MCACRHVSGACVSSEGERLQFDRGTKGGGGEGSSARECQHGLEWKCSKPLKRLGVCVCLNFQ